MQDDRLTAAIDAAIDAHAEWKRHLHRAIETGVTHLSPATAACDDKCTLGIWLYSPELSAQFRGQIHYGDVRQQHALFHKTAASVLSYVERGNVSAAQFIMAGEYDFRSEGLIEALMRWKVDFAVEPAIRSARG